MTSLTTLLLLLVAALPLGAASSDPALRVAAGEELRAKGDALLAMGDVLIEGDLLAAPGLDLRVETPGDIIVRGRIVGSAGAPGEDGGDVVLHARRIVVHPEGRIEAGPGGHGASAIVPDGIAVAGHGGDGGSVVLLTSLHEVQGALAPGRGGDGGHAYGATAVGGDGGDSGSAVVSGAPVAVDEVAAQAQPLAPLRDVLSPSVQSHCTVPAGVAPPIAPRGVGGGNGGDACAHGADGPDGVHGVDGSDDECWLCGVNNHPPCGSFTTSGNDHQNGEIGQHGGSYGILLPEYARPPGKGDDAEAMAGRGGDALNAGVRAGNGGTAEARGGQGGDGGNGGVGGDANLKGEGCRGGNGGDGAPGGKSKATGGLQGINLSDCRMDGNSGVPVAVLAGGGANGAGGAGGDGLTNGRDGPRGADGRPGPEGQREPLAPDRRVCALPGAPTIRVLGSLPMAEACGHRVVIKPPVDVGGSAVQWYNVYLNFSTTPIAAVPASETGAATFAHTPLPHGVTYVYEVSAHTAAGDGPKSAGVMRTTSCMDLAAPVGPGGLVELIDVGMSPLLTAEMAPGVPGRVKLAIQHPALVPVSTIDRYQVWRSETGLPNDFTRQPDTPRPPAGPSFEHHDVGDPLTGYHYYVVPVVGGVEGSRSNVAFAISALFVQTGSGTGGVVSEYERATPSAEPILTHTCSNVASEFNLREEGKAYSLNVRTGRPPSPVAGPGDPWCESGASKGTRHYTNRFDETRTGSCDVVTTPGTLRTGPHGWEATQELTCDDRVAETHRVNVTSTGRGYRLVQEVEAFEPSGRSVLWRLTADMASLDAPAHPRPSPDAPRCPRPIPDNPKVGCHTMETTT